MSDHIKNTKSVKKIRIKLDGFRKNGKNLRVHFWELPENLFYYEFNLYIDILSIVYVFYAKILFLKRLM